MGKDDVLQGLVMELRRGTIVLCVLAQLKKPMYGYHLVTTLSESGVPVEANTLYPLLRRLESQGLLQSQWNTQEAKPRKYYSTTPMGNEVFETLKTQWSNITQSMQALLETEEEAQ